ncbi:MAG: glycosyltransferase family 4 protein [Bacteroidia bacterium]
MKIVFVIPIMGCGGAEILIGEIAKSLALKGHEVHILCLQPHHYTWLNYPDKENLLKLVNIEVVGGGVVFGLLRPPAINNSGYVESIKRIKPDVIHSHLFLSELLSRSFLVEGVKYFTHGHDNLPQLRKVSVKTFINKQFAANYRERAWLKKRYIQCNNSFVAISRDVENYLKDNRPESKKRVYYLPNAINTKRFENTRDYSMVNGPFRMASIANLVPKKNHVFLIDVLKVLKNRGFDVEIEVFGMGPLQEMLIEKTREAGLSGNLFFRGSVGDIPEKLKNAHLYVHPAWYEPFGLVLLEAMASGLPVVSLDGYGNRELLNNHENGYLLPKDCTAEEFADKIIYFIENSAERERMGKNAVEFAKTYDIDHYTDKLLEIYNA